MKETLKEKVKDQKFYAIIKKERKGKSNILEMVGHTPRPVISNIFWT